MLGRGEETDVEGLSGGDVTEGRRVGWRRGDGMEDRGQEEEEGWEVDRELHFLRSRW